MSFELVEPGSLKEVFGLLDPGDSAVRPLAGGTALMLLLKSGFFRPKRLVSLRAASARLSAIRVEADGRLRIGAMTRLATLERAPEIRGGFPVIAQTLRTLSNVRVRNVATLGGHLAHADPHTDLPPVLVALGARRWGHDGQDASSRSNRPLGAAVRRPRQGHRPRGIHPQSAPSRHAARQALPQPGCAWPNPVR